MSATPFYLFRDSNGLYFSVPVHSIERIYQEKASSGFPGVGGQLRTFVKLDDDGETIELFPLINSAGKDETIQRITDDLLNL